MKVAVIGSRSIRAINLGDYLPPGTTELVSGGARGVDRLAEDYARAHGLKLTVFRPDYARYRKGAPLYRNRAIVDYCDCLLAFWDGHSTGTAQTIACCKEQNKPYQVILLSPDE